MGCVCGILRRAKVLRSNFIKTKGLKELKDEVILPADKRNVTMMTRSCDYDRKMEMLGTGTYGRLGPYFFLFSLWSYKM